MTVALVTGGTGFIGAHLVRRLRRRRVEVHVLCRAESDRWRLADVAAKLRWHRQPLADQRGLRRLAARIRPDYIFHLAAAVMHGGQAAAPAEILATTVLGTVNLIEACDGIPYRCLVHTGDAFEYQTRRRPLRESDACCPTTIDGIAKLAATRYALAVAEQRGRPIAVVRPFSVYGPRDDPRRLIPRLLVAALDGTPISLSQRRICRDFVHVDDVVDLYLALARRPRRSAGEIFNAGSGRQTSLDALVKLIGAVVGTPCHAAWGVYPSAPHDFEPHYADIAKALARVGWRPRLDLRTGLARTLAAARRAR